MVKILFRSIIIEASRRELQKYMKKTMQAITNWPKSKGKNPEVDLSIVLVLKREHCHNSFPINQFT